MKDFARIVTFVLFVLVWFSVSFYVSHNDRQEIQQEFEQLENSSSSQAGKGFLAEMRGDYKSAIEYFSKAIELNPQDAISYHQRGLCYYYLNDNDNAMKDFDKTISLDPNHTDAYGNRSLVKMELKDYQGALDDIEKVLKIMPDYQKAIKQKEMILNKMQYK